MPFTTPIRVPPPALGMTASVLGVIAMLLFFMPVLGIPLSICGVVIGVAGLVASLTVVRSDLRWSVTGLAAALLALAINVAIALAPAGYLRDQNVPRSWQAVPDRPVAPPPAGQP